MTVLRDAPQFCDEPEGFYTSNGVRVSEWELRQMDAMTRLMNNPTPPLGNPVLAVLDEMRAITMRKNSDYANSEDVFANFRECEDFEIDAFAGVLVRMSDKWKRIKNLQKKATHGEGPAVADEGLRDTLIDLGNYAAIAVCLLDERKEGKA